MNVYFISNIFNLREDNLHIFLDILKVKKIISFTTNYPKICEPMLIYRNNINPEEWYSEEVYPKIKKAVYKLTNPICEPIYENGKWTEKFKINDLYKNSNSCNPIYNLEHCNDENILVINCQLDYSFIEFSINILKKYAPEFNYENKICFLKFETTNDYIIFNDVNLYYYGKFYLLQRYRFYNENEKKSLPNHVYGKLSYSSKDVENMLYKERIRLGKYYYPFVSYLHLKSQKFFNSETNIYDFFLNNEDYLYHEFWNRISNIEDREASEKAFYRND